MNEARKVFRENFDTTIVDSFFDEMEKYEFLAVKGTHQWAFECFNFIRRMLELSDCPFSNSSPILELWENGLLRMNPAPKEHSSSFDPSLLTISLDGGKKFVTFSYIDGKLFVKGPKNNFSIEENHNHIYHKFTDQEIESQIIFNDLHKFHSPNFRFYNLNFK